jgi:hypothetical protein
MRTFLLAAAVATCVALGLPAVASAAQTASPAANPATSTTGVPGALGKVPPHGGGNSFIICFPVYTGPFGKIWQCYTIEVPVLVAGPGDGGCPQCGEAVDLTYDPIDYKIQPTIVDELAQGYQLLGQAAVSTSPAEAAKLHTAAISEFTSAARTIGTEKVTAKQFGYVDPASGKFEPEPSPWRAQAGTDVVKAIAGLQSYLAKGNKGTLADATAALDDSYQVLAKNAATIG